MPDPLYNTRRIFLNAVARAGTFTPIARFEDLPPAPYFDSRSWSARVFHTGRGHGDARIATHGYRAAPNHASYDMLRHEYIWHGLRITTIESRVFLHVSAPAQATLLMSQHDPARRAALLATELFRLPTPLAFAWIDDERCADHLTSRLVGPFPKLKTWNERIDAVVDDETVTLLVYKVRPNGDPSVNAADWFASSLRTAG